MGGFVAAVLSLLVASWFALKPAFKDYSTREDFLTVINAEVVSENVRISIEADHVFSGPKSESDFFDKNYLRVYVFSGEMSRSVTFVGVDSAGSTYSWSKSFGTSIYQMVNRVKVFHDKPKGVTRIGVVLEKDWFTVFILGVLMYCLWFIVFAAFASASDK